jgi:hypothetical protein
MRFDKNPYKDLPTNALLYGTNNVQGWYMILRLRFLTKTIEYANPLNYELINGRCYPIIWLEIGNFKGYLKIPFTKHRLHLRCIWCPVN